MPGIFYVPEEEKIRFLNALDAELARIKKEVTEIYRGFVTATFHRVLLDTPQWTGNAVANWNVSLGQIDYSVNYTFKEQHVQKWIPLYQKGATPASMSAATRAASTIASISLDNPVPVYFANSAENLDHKSYIQYLEVNINNFLRDVNKPGHMVENTARLAGNMGELRLAQQYALRALRVGQLYNPGVGI